MQTCLPTCWPSGRNWQRNHTHVVGILAVAAKLTKCQTVLSTWELTFQRNALLDGITLLRTAAAAATKPEEFESLVQTLYWEQVYKLRSPSPPRDEATWRTPFRWTRGTILRQALYAYLRQAVPK